MALHSDLRYSVRAADGVYLMRTLMANVAFISDRPAGGSSPAPDTVDELTRSSLRASAGTVAPARAKWVLVDAGIRGYANQIQHAAEECFGPGTRPECIVLTHGHFDHVGSLHALLARWPVPVYAHVLEMPHLTGRVDYPPPDPLAGGGMMAWSSRLLPKGAIDVGPKLMALPPDGRVPGVHGWEWIHTPGHTPGHVSLFRREDRVLVAGDAVITTKQESLLAVATQRREVHGPPAYFTSDWDAARESVWRLASLQPEVLATGHGLPLRGAAMRHALHMVATHFDEVERPRFGRYATEPAVLMPDGRYRLPRDPFPIVLGAAAALGALIYAGGPGRPRSTRRIPGAVSPRS